MTDDPLTSVMEQRLLRAIDKGLADTRHTMRDEITHVAVGVANAQEKSTQEHALVQLALVEMRGDIAELRSAVADLKPLKGEVAQLQSHEANALGRDKAIEGLRGTIWKAAGLVVAAAGVLVAVLR